MTFDHDFGYSFPFSQPSLNKREEEKENEFAKIVIKGHAFLLDLKDCKSSSFELEFKFFDEFSDKFLKTCKNF